MGVILPLPLPLPLALLPARESLRAPGESFIRRARGRAPGATRLMHTCHRARTSLFILRSNIHSYTDSHIHSHIHSLISTPPAPTTSTTSCSHSPQAGSLCGGLAHPLFVDTPRCAPRTPLQMQEPLHTALQGVSPPLPLPSTCRNRYIQPLQASCLLGPPGASGASWSLLGPPGASWLS